MSSLVVHDGEDLQDPGHVGNSKESDEGDLVGLYQEEADGEGERAEAGGDEAADGQAGDDVGEAATLEDVNISQDQPSSWGLRVDELSLKKDEEVADQEK